MQVFFQTNSISIIYFLYNITIICYLGRFVFIIRLPYHIQKNSRCHPHIEIGRMKTFLRKSLVSITFTISIPGCGFDPLDHQIGGKYSLHIKKDTFPNQPALLLLSSRPDIDDHHNGREHTREYRKQPQVAEYYQDVDMFKEVSKKKIIDNQP